MDAELTHYQLAAIRMLDQLQVLSELIGRDLTSSERENIHDFLLDLPITIQEEFEERAGRLL